MNIKRIMLVGVTVVAMLLFAGVAVAQDGPENRPPQSPDGDILRELMDIKIFIDTDADERFIRRLKSK